jgi:WD40 repeat protein
MVRGNLPLGSVLLVLLTLLSREAPVSAGAQKAPGPQVRKDAFGDPLPERALVRIGTTRLHGGGEAVAMSRDGRYLASCDGRVLHVWDGKSGKLLWRFELPQWGPWALSISPDDKEVAAVSRSFEGKPGSNDFFRWDLATGRLLQKDKNHPGKSDGTVVSVALACRPDGSYLVAETGVGTIALHFQGELKPAKLLKGHTGRVMSVAFLGDGASVASLAEDGTIRFWNVAEGKEIARVPVPAMKKYGLQGNLATLAASGDGQYLAVLLPDQSTRLLDANGKELHRLTEAENVRALAFAPDAKALLTGGSWLQLWNVATGKEIAILGEPRVASNHLALSPDGKTVAFATGPNRVCLADVAGGKRLFAAAAACQAGLAFTPDGQHLTVAAGDTTIALWKVAKLRAAEKGFPGKPVAVLVCEGKVMTFAFSPDGKRLATAEAGGMSRLYDTASHKVLWSVKAANDVFAIAFSPDGKFLATVGTSWPGPHHTRPVEQMEWTGQVARLWDAVTGKEIPLPKEIQLTGHTLAFPPAGKALLALHLPAQAKKPISGSDLGQLPSVEDRLETIRLWDLTTGRESLRFEDPLYRATMEQSSWSVTLRGASFPCAFSPDGRLFAVAGFSGLVLFETASGRPRLRLDGQGGVTGVAFTPDGKTLISSGSDATVMVWDVTGLQTVGKLAGKVEDLWPLLADADVERAGQAVWAIMDMPAQAVPFLRKHVQRVPANKELVQKLIADLDDPKFAVRDKAMRELATQGLAAEKALTAKSKQPGISLEMSKRIEKLLATLRSTPPTPEQLRLVRAVEVLEGIATAAAREMLEDLASGAEDALLTIHASEAVQRLRRQAGPA